MILLLKNSEMLKINSIETAKENERGIIEIDTLKKTQENLIQTIEETLMIQADGREKRKAAEIEIGRMEEELKQRLLAVHEKTKPKRLSTEAWIRIKNKKPPFIRRFFTDIF